MQVCPCISRQYEKEGNMSQDRIEREVAISAPIERVWAVLTEPEHVGAWFGTGAPAEIDLHAGGVMVLDHGSHGVYPTVIVKLDPPRALSYRWASGYPGVVATEDNSTLVEFTLEPTSDGTLLRVVESGFEALVIPAERVEDAGFESHSNGWSGVVLKLAAHAEGGDLSPLLASA
jgi:uncharacterized protein YndB with AHSA1/START domain